MKVINYLLIITLITVSLAQAMQWEEMPSCRTGKNLMQMKDEIIAFIQNGSSPNYSIPRLVLIRKYITDIDFAIHEPRSDEDICELRELKAQLFALKAQTLLDENRNQDNYSGR